ncbi:MAG: orotidine-5'-phosphate decarboxylase [Pelagibacteraceae bacterium]|nr:orotidine-5'-phosphate decarboxylase [Pelagibacteraceae bacterium]PPR52161.1 MAG: Orotidine 5'-phosphate decarboxylase [Alphaproteobacteria bacterium MarineAlpha5_Bin10]|tara:strand:- start:8058 stop:8750 length:693 start_codon:yes stop_codon:yes gene_type:complete
MSDKSKIILALDLDDNNKIQKIVSEVSNDIYGIKIGYQYLFNFGIKKLSFFKKKKLKIFFDFKLHDIPNTVSRATEALARFKPDMMTVHISGSESMLKFSKKYSKNIKIIGVSALTSLNKKDITKIYKRSNAEKLVRDMVKIAINAKIDGIVCSPKEIKLVKKISKNKLTIITPGIRPNKNKAKNDDQKRFLSPKRAIELGADYIVIGRPILNSKNPKKLVKSINEETKL